MAIAAIRDLDDTGLHPLQKELGLCRSEITIDGKNFDNETCHDPHINRNQITVRKVSWLYEKRESSSPVRTVGAPTPTTRSTFGSHLRARRVGEAEVEQCPIFQPCDNMHSYSPSTQALLRMLLLRLLPRHAMS